MEFSKLLDKRRSCRSYTGAPITKKQLDYIIYAAVHAPSACNKQSWHFTVICDREVIKKFSPEYTGNSWIVNCGAVITSSLFKTPLAPSKTCSLPRLTKDLRDAS